MHEQSMNVLPARTAEVEESRIRTAYARRQNQAMYSWFLPSTLFIVQERERRLLALLKQHGIEELGTKKILEIGCGSGYWLRAFIQWGARPQNIFGVDLIPDRVDEARMLCPAAVDVRLESGAQLRFADATFDLVLQSTVFTSILDPHLKQKVAHEMLRVVKNDGLILWYDFHVNNPSNPDVRGVTKGEITQLFSGCRIELERITLAPPICRLLAPYTWLGCYLLERIPWLCTHYLGVIKKQGLNILESVL